MILLAASRAMEGLVMVSAWRAVFTRWVGSLMKCLEDMVAIRVNVLEVKITL